MSIPGSRPGERLYGESVPVQLCSWRNSEGGIIATVHLDGQSRDAILAYGAARNLTLVEGPQRGTIPKKDELLLREYNKDGMVRCPCRR